LALGGDILICEGQRMFVSLELKESTVQSRWLINLIVIPVLFFCIEYDGCVVVMSKVSGITHSKSTR
jgi:hypothetical protein